MPTIPPADPPPSDVGDIAGTPMPIKFDAADPRVGTGMKLLAGSAASAAVVEKKDLTLFTHDEVAVRSDAGMVKVIWCMRGPSMVFI